MIKLKDLLKESFTTKYWGNRKFGDKLPTLDDYKKLKEGEINEASDLDKAYDKLHDALQRAHVAIKQHGDRNALKAFKEWWDELDRFYPDPVQNPK